MSPERIGILLAGLAAAGLLAAGGLRADLGDDGGEQQRLAVTVTNLTRGQRFTPILVASHSAAVRLFDLGQPASPELARVAEEGDTAPLATLLGANPGVLDVQVGDGLLDPGQSRTVTIRTRGSLDLVSVVAMLIPTNDGFFALGGVKGPEGNGTSVFFSPAYDAGSEVNDERCASIPGPGFDECGGPGGGAAPSGGEEGYVHIHAGIHGSGDMDRGRRDWRNPVARVTIRHLP